MRLMQSLKDRFSKAPEGTAAQREKAEGRRKNKRQDCSLAQAA
jgi:hypothetical protein